MSLALPPVPITVCVRAVWASTPNVCLHAEGPLIALLARVHLLIPLTGAILGERLCSDQGGATAIPWRGNTPRSARWASMWLKIVRSVGNYSKRARHRTQGHLGPFLGSEVVNESTARPSYGVDHSVVFGMRAWVVANTTNGSFFRIVLRTPG